FNANGLLQGQIQLPVLPSDIGPGQYHSELVSVGDYLVLLLEPVYLNAQQTSESRMYLIDPRSGQVWLTYRKVNVLPNQKPVVQISSPSEGALLPLGSNQLGAVGSIRMDSSRASNSSPMARALASAGVL